MWLNKTQKRIGITIRKIRGGYRHGTWIDEYNLTSSEIAGTVYSRINQANHIYVLCVEDGSDGDGEEAAQGV